MEIKLEIPIRPIPHQSVRVSYNGRFYQPKKIQDYKKELQKVVTGLLPDDFSIIEANTEIYVTKLHYVFEYPKSFSKKKINSDGIKYKFTKPDLHDNLNKALFDALEGVIWERDQNVVSINSLKKYYGKEDKIIIHVRTLSEES